MSKVQTNMSQHYSFFATRFDLLSLLDKLEGQQSVHYIRTGLFDSDELPLMNTARCIEQLGIAVAGDQNHVPSYLIVDAETRVNVRKIPQRSGGITYGVDQLENPKSIVMKPGGEFDDIAIIAGEFGTVSRDNDSLSLLAKVSKQLRKEFKNIKGWYVSRNAIKAMDSGMRLTASVKSPLEYDLRIDSDSSAFNR